MTNTFGRMQVANGKLKMKSCNMPKWILHEIFGLILYLTRSLILDEMIKREYFLIRGHPTDNSKPGIDAENAWISLLE